MKISHVLSRLIKLTRRLNAISEHSGDDTRLNIVDEILALDYVINYFYKKMTRYVVIVGHKSLVSTFSKEVQDTKRSKVTESYGDYLSVIMSDNLEIMVVAEPTSSFVRSCLAWYNPDNNPSSEIPEKTLPDNLICRQLFPAKTDDGEKVAVFDVSVMDSGKSAIQAVSSWCKAVFMKLQFEQK